MSEINQECMTAIQPELVSGETVLWTGKPNTAVVFHKEDAFLVPFSLLWGGFAIFWEASVLGLVGAQNSSAPSFFVLWGIPFVVIGQYLIWGRFFVSGWKKRRTYYALTNRRAIVVQDGWSRKMASAYLDSIPMLVKQSERSDGLGTLRFAPEEPLFSNRRSRSWGVWDSMNVGDTPVFRDIENLQSVYRIACEQRDRLREAKPIFPN